MITLLRVLAWGFVLSGLLAEDTVTRMSVVSIGLGLGLVLYALRRREEQR